MEPGAAIAAARETQILGWLFVVPSLVAVAALILYPMVHGFRQSIQSGGFLFGEKPGYVGLRNYRDVLHDPTSRQAMAHTVWYVLLAVSLELVLGILVAVTLHRVFRGRGFVLAVLILPWALPSVVSGVLWQRVFDPDNGLLNSVLLQLHVISQPHVWLAVGPRRDRLHHARARVGGAAADQPDLPGRAAEHPRRGLQRLLGRRRRPVCASSRTSRCRCCGRRWRSR